MSQIFPSFYLRLTANLGRKCILAAKCPCLSVCLSVHAAQTWISFDIFWHLLTSFDIFWHHLTSFDIFWHLLTSFIIFWHLLTSFDSFTFFDSFWNFMTAYDSIWQLMTAYDRLWQLSEQLTRTSHCLLIFLMCVLHGLRISSQMAASCEPVLLKSEADLCSWLDKKDFVRSYHIILNWMIY